jgi:hypothetical protein
MSVNWCVASHSAPISFVVFGFLIFPGCRSVIINFLCVCVCVSRSQAVNQESMRSALKRNEQLEADLDAERKRANSLQSSEYEANSYKSLVAQLRSEIQGLKDQLNQSHSHIAEYERTREIFISDKTELQSQVWPSPCYALIAAFSLIPRVRCCKRPDC